MNISINPNKPIILIDESYYIFNRFYATLCWFKKKYDDSEITDLDNLTINNEFLVAFFRHFDNDMVKICKNLKTIKSNIIFSIDCSRVNIWRNELYDSYKANRPKKLNFDSNIFVLFKEYISKNHYQSCEYDKLEADDVTYILQKRILSEIDNVKIIIITNDNDYLQLYNKNTNIINMQFNDISLRIKNTPDVELQFKIIYGDKSDNIPKIDSKITKELAFKLANMKYNELITYLMDNNYYSKYQLNKKLVDLSEIPNEFIELFNEKYNIIFKNK